MKIWMAWWMNRYGRIRDKRACMPGCKWIVDGQRGWNE